MEKIDVDPWINTGKKAYEILRFHGYLPSIPHVVGENGLTFVKSREKFYHEQRLLPERYYGLFNEKSPGLMHLSPPLEVGKMCQAFFKSGSSQHMSSILEGIAEIGVDFKDIQFIVASETLHKIASSVFKQTRSWRLRAYLEVINRQKVIVVCNDDFEEIELMPLRDTPFVKERRESINFAQSLCEQYKSRNTNHFLHGSRVVVASLTHRNSSVNMVVVGEMDMAFDKKPLNVAVMTGRPNRVCLGNYEEQICDSYEYIWSRCFWIGITTCIIGMRSTSEEPVKAIHRFDIRDYAQKHRGRIGKNHDTATTCVAHVMVCLRDAIQSRPNVNWIIEYKGRPEHFEPADIKMEAAESSYSFWQVCENYYISKLDYKKRKQEEEEQRARKRKSIEEASKIKELRQKQETIAKTLKVETQITPGDLRTKEGQFQHEVLELAIPITSEPYTSEIRSNKTEKVLPKEKKIESQETENLTANMDFSQQEDPSFEFPISDNLTAVTNESGRKVRKSQTSTVSGKIPKKVAIQKIEKRLTRACRIRPRDKKTV